MCNLYSLTKGPQAIRDFVRATRSDVGNMPPMPGIFPDYSAPIVFAVTIENPNTRAAHFPCLPALLRLVRPQRPR